MDCLGPSGAIVLQPGASQAVALSAGAIREPRSPLGATSAGARGEERRGERGGCRENGLPFSPQGRSAAAGPSPPRSPRSC